MFEQVTKKRDWQSVEIVGTSDSTLDPFWDSNRRSGWTFVICSSSGDHGYEEWGSMRRETPMICISTGHEEINSGVTDALLSDFAKVT